MTTTKSDMLARIKRASDSRDHNEALKAQAAHNRLMAKVIAIKSLATRIADLLDIAIELDEKGFPLGKQAKDWIKPQEFVTEGIEHGIGFYVRNHSHGNGYPKYPYAFGIEGGGYSGYGLEIDREGNIVRGMPDCYGSAEDKMQYVIDHFDDFERKFYEYVKSI